MKRISCIAAAIALGLPLSGCASGGSSNEAIRTGPQAVHPMDAARGTGLAAAATPTYSAQTSTSHVATLFNGICAANGDSADGAVAAAIASGAFGAPVRDADGLGGQTTRLQTPDGQIEAVIGSGGFIGTTCGVGNRSGSETYILTPNGSVRPA